MSLRTLLLLLFVALPLAEIYVLVQVGSAIGGIATVALVVFSAVLGSLLVRHQGFRTLQEIRRSLDRGEAPAIPMLEGGVLVIGGILLLIPGFITDLIGALLLIAPLRRAMIVRFVSRIATPARPPGGGPPDAPAPPRTIEGEYRRED